MAPICSIESVNNKLKLSLNKMGFTIDSIQLSAKLCVCCVATEQTLTQPGEFLSSFIE